MMPWLVGLGLMYAVVVPLMLGCCRAAGEADERSGIKDGTDPVLRPGPALEQNVPLAS